MPPLGKALLLYNLFNLRRVLSFALYDTGETILGAIVFSTFYPLYITKHIDPELYSTLYGFAFFLSFLMAVPLAKLADSRAYRKRFFVLFTLLTSVLGILLSFTIHIPTLNLFLYLLVAVFHQQAMVFYNSLLGGFESKGTASGVGVAFGYLGSALSLLFLAEFLNVPEVFYQTALIFLFLSLPAISLLPNPPQKTTISLRKELKDRRFLLLVLAILSLTEVANTLIAMMGIYLKHAYGLEDREIYKVIGLSALGGVFGGLFFGKLTDKLKARRLFPLGFILWSLFLIVLYLTPRELLLFVGFLGGLSLSHLWTTSRVLLLELLPLETVSLRMSFLSLSERIASTTGLWVWSLFMLLTGNDYKLSALLMVVFPVVGIFFYLFSRR
jgi:UMF1 family MFS transporter